MLTARFLSRLDERWRDLPATALGTARGAPATHLVVLHGSAPVHRLDLHVGPAERRLAPPQARFFGATLVVGIGERVHVVPWPPREPARTIALRAGFVALHHGPDAIYVATGEDVTRLALDGDPCWTSPQLAAAGVRVELVTDDEVVGEALVDPPHGWRPFRLRAADGERDD